MTTASEETLREVGEKEVLSDPVPETLRRQVRTRASSVALPPAGSLKAVTERVRLAGQVTAVRLAVLLDKPGTLVHSQPPTFRQAHARHHECAGHFGVPVLRGLRLLWGYFHLLVIMPVLYLAVWVTESPLRFFVTAALIAAIWLWS